MGVNCGCEFNDRQIVWRAVRNGKVPFACKDIGHKLRVEEARGKVEVVVREKAVGSPQRSHHSASWRKGRRRQQLLQRLLIAVYVITHRFAGMNRIGTRSAGGAHALTHSV